MKFNNRYAASLQLRTSFTLTKNLTEVLLSKTEEVLWKKKRKWKKEWTTSLLNRLNIGTGNDSNNHGTMLDDLE
ncbi:hypothetical protein DPMN_141889 [Dreissena polymorpha]|uniref:Uncharacterized protein n=1 Tax=Dreissena polymorpha TaxID=45954 RepID=A0A9D4GAU7_DREPO|nr:hypothetical protein DPMN_141889 [Dreissena polymorpha]